MHVKDMVRDPDGKYHSVVMGTGIVDYHPILRAATGLSRMLVNCGRNAEARHLLQPIHDWFTEGFDWPELLSAKSILADLDSTSASDSDPKRPITSLGH